MKKKHAAAAAAGRLATMFAAAVSGRVSAATTRTAAAAAAIRAPLHTSAVQLESKRRRAARLRRTANLQQREVKQRLFDMSKPDPVLAHQPNEEGRALWEHCELAQLLLSKDEVWGFTQDRRGQLVSVDPVPRPDDAAVDAEAEQYGGPRRLNFGLDADARRTLFRSLPRVMVEDRILDSPAMQTMHEQGTDALAQEYAQHEAEQQRSADTLARILDLRNASGKAIQVENTRRIIQHFGARDDGRGLDTGSPEVQGTYCVSCTAPLTHSRDHDLPDPEPGRPPRPGTPRQQQPACYDQAGASARQGAALSQVARPGAVPGFPAAHWRRGARRRGRDCRAWQAQGEAYLKVQRLRRPTWQPANTPGAERLACADIGLIARIQ